MAVPTVRASPGTGSGNPSSTSLSITQPDSFTDGDVVFLFVNWIDGPGTVTWPDATFAANAVEQLGQQPQAAYSWKHVTDVSAEPSTYDLSWTNASKNVGTAIASPDCDTTDPFDVVGFTPDGTTDTTVELDAVTTTVDDCLLLLWYGQNNDRTITGPGTQLVAVTRGAAGVDLGLDIETDSQVTAGSTGDKDGTASGNISDAYSAIVAIQEPQGGGGTTVTPGVITTTTTVPTPTAAGEASVSPGSVATTTTVPTPATSAGQTVTPDAVATTTTVPTPTPTGGALVTPGGIATTTTVPTPTPAGGGAAAPAAVATISTIPTPSITVGKTVTPDAVATVTTLPDPTATGAAMASPSVIATSTTLPTPLVVTDIIVTPDVIVTTASLPQPAASVAANVTPAAVATTIAMSAPTPVGGTIVSPDVIETLVDVLLPLASGDVIEIAAESWVQFQRIGTTLVLAEIGRGGRRGFATSEGFDRVSEVIAVDNTDNSQGHRDAAMLAVASAWAVNAAASAATLKAAIDSALDAAGFRDPNGDRIV